MAAAAAAESLIGRLPGGLFASQALTGPDDDVQHSFEKWVADLTPNDVNAAMRKYIDPVEDHDREGRRLQEPSAEAPERRPLRWGQSPDNILSLRRGRSHPDSGPSVSFRLRLTGIVTGTRRQDLTQIETRLRKLRRRASRGDLFTPGPRETKVEELSSAVRCTGMTAA